MRDLIRDVIGYCACICNTGIIRLSDKILTESWKEKRSRLNKFYPIFHLRTVLQWIS